MTQKALPAAKDETAPLKSVGVLVKSAGVLAVMTLAMVCSTATVASAPVRTVIRAVPGDHPLMFFGDGQLRVRTLLFGFAFVGWMSIALVLTRAWHGVRPVRRTAVQAAAFVGLGLTMILVAAAGLSAVRASGTHAVYLGLTVAASALGAHIVARGTRQVTGRPKPLLTRSMFLWGVCWVGIQQVLEHLREAAAAPAVAAGVVPAGARVAHIFSPELVLAWQLPLGLAVAAWFLRTHSPPIPELRGPAAAARSWAKASVLVATALLLLGVAVSAIERNRVQVDELDVVPTDEPEGEFE